MTDDKTGLIERVLRQYNELNEQLSDPDIANDMEKLKELSRERSRMNPLVELIEKEREIWEQLSDVKEQLKSENDAEFTQVLNEEATTLEAQHQKVSAELEFELLPKSPDAGKNMFIEVRAGTGGDEAALFAKDLFRMYVKFIEQTDLKYEVITMSETGLHGLKEVVFLVRGDSAYDLFHFEAGTHRVQRIPETESGGRIHTSAVTVAVIPEVEDFEVDIDPNELRIDVFRSSGPGGQSVNTTDSAIRITHIPSGLVVSCQDEKSQHKNKAKALKVLRARLQQKEREEKHEKSVEEKRAQIGSGDRSEKIRTYNYPQNRLTDHRIHYTSHNLDRAMEGDLRELFEAMQKAERDKMLGKDD